MTAQPLLRVRGLEKRFGNHAVLRGIDLDVMPGDRIAILAPRAGQEQLLRCLNFWSGRAPAASSSRTAIGRAAPGKADPGRRSYASRADASAPRSALCSSSSTCSRT